MVVFQCLVVAQFTLPNSLATAAGYGGSVGDASGHDAQVPVDLQQQTIRPSTPLPALGQTAASSVPSPPKCHDSPTLIDLELFDNPILAYNEGSNEETVKQGEQQGDANQSNSKKQKTDQSDGISVSIQNPKGKLVAVISSTGSGNITMTN